MMTPLAAWTSFVTKILKEEEPRFGYRERSREGSRVPRPEPRPLPVFCATMALLGGLLRPPFGIGARRGVEADPRQLASWWGSWYSEATASELGSFAAWHPRLTMRQAGVFA